MIKRSYNLIQQYELTRQLFRYGFVGVAAAFVNYVMVVFLVSCFKMQPLVANGVGFLVAFQVSFSGHRLWTFEQDDFSWPMMSKFFLVASLSFLLSEVLYAYFMHKLHLQYAVALLLVLCIVPVLSFICSKLWAFK